MLNELIRDQDSYVASSYMYKDRNGKLFQGPLWDLNLTFGVGCCHNNRSIRGWQFDVNVGDVFFTQGEREWNRRMFMDEDWTQAFIDRWHEARQDVLDLTNLFARVDAHADPLIEAEAHNSAKYPNVLGNANPGFPSSVSDTWQEQIDSIKDDWPSRRIEWIDSQFVVALQTGNYLHGPYAARGISSIAKRRMIPPTTEPKSVDLLMAEFQI